MCNTFWTEESIDVKTQADHDRELEAKANFEIAGELYRGLGDHPNAQKSLQHALHVSKSIAGGSMFAHDVVRVSALFAQACIESNDPESAHAVLKSVLKDAPDERSVFNADTREALKRCRRMLKQTADI